MGAKQGKIRGGGAETKENQGRIVTRARSGRTWEASMGVMLYHIIWTGLSQPRRPRPSEIYCKPPGKNLFSAPHTISNIPSCPPFPHWAVFQCIDVLLLLRMTARCRGWMHWQNSYYSSPSAPSHKGGVKFPGAPQQCLVLFVGPKSI